MWFYLILSTFFCAVIGAITLTLAARIVLFSTRNRQRIAKEVGKLAATEFASLNLEDKIGDPANFKKLAPFIENHVDDFLRNKLKEQMPMISMFIGDKTIQTMKTVFMQELETLFPQVMKQFVTNLKNDSGIEQIVTAKLASIPSSQLEKMLAKPLRMAGLLGAITGFIVGLLQTLLFIVL